MFFKFKWLLSALIMKFFCGKLAMPSYFAIPIFFTGMKSVFIGRRVRIFPGSRFETHGDGSIVIEDNVGIGQNFHITSSGFMRIGSGTVITANVSITNIDHKYEDISESILNQGINVTKTSIGSNCFIGNGVMIQAGTVLGNHCIVGSNSVVKGVFPDRCVIAGVPAKIIKIYDSSSQTWERVNNA